MKKSIYIIGVFVIGLASDMARVFGLDDAASDLATRTIQWLSFFNLAFAISFVLQAALRASGDAWTPLWVGIGCNVIKGCLIVRWFAAESDQRNGKQFRRKQKRDDVFIVTRNLFELFISINIFG